MGRPIGPRSKTAHRFEALLGPEEFGENVGQLCGVTEQAVYKWERMDAYPHYALVILDLMERLAKANVNFNPNKYRLDK